MNPEKTKNYQGWVQVQGNRKKRHCRIRFKMCDWNTSSCFFTYVVQSVAIHFKGMAMFFRIFCLLWSNPLSVPTAAAYRTWKVQGIRNQKKIWQIRVWKDSVKSGDSPYVFDCEAASNSRIKTNAMYESGVSAKLCCMMLRSR